jgi:hypothetical protein
MKKTTRWVGLDAHAETIAVAVAEKDGTVQSLGTVRNRPESIGRLFKRLGKDGCKLMFAMKPVRAATRCTGS